MQSALARGFQEFLTTAANAMRDHPARVEAIPDPKVAGRIGYLISGPRLSVESMCRRLAETVDTALGGKPGHAHFTEPVRDGTEWVAVGWVFVEQAR